MCLFEIFILLFFFFKQKTAYEMRISDWSSDVCSSDLYAEIVGYLVDTWKVASRSLTGKAAKAQDFLCAQSERLSSLADMVAEDIAARPKAAFSWIHNRDRKSVV